MVAQNLPSRLEIDLMRVVHETQKMASGLRDKDWTYDKNVQWLRGKIKELEVSPCCPDSDVLASYKRDIQQLESVMESHLKHSSENEDEVISLLRHRKIDLNRTDTSHAAPPPLKTYQEDLSQKIHQIKTGSNTTRQRRKLLTHELNEEEGNEEDSIQRIATKDVLEAEEEKREAWLQEMVTQAKQWKDQSKAVNVIIRKDNETLSRNLQNADKNRSKLEIESDRLSELNKRACNCCIWLVILLVFCSFISIVLFIRLFPK